MRRARRTELSQSRHARSAQGETSPCDALNRSCSSLRADGTLAGSEKDLELQKRRNHDLQETHKANAKAYQKLRVSADACPPHSNPTPSLRDVFASSCNTTRQSSVPYSKEQKLRAVGRRASSCHRRRPLMSPARARRLSSKVSSALSEDGRRRDRDKPFRIISPSARSHGITQVASRSPRGDRSRPRRTACSRRAEQDLGSPIRLLSLTAARVSRSSPAKPAQLATVDRAELGTKRRKLADQRNNSHSSSNFYRKGCSRLGVAATEASGPPLIRTTLGR